MGLGVAPLDPFVFANGIPIFLFTGAIFLLVVSSSVTLSVPFLMGKVIDVVQEASDKGVLQGTLIPAAAFLSFIFVIGAVANTGRVYLLQMSGTSKLGSSLKHTRFTASYMDMNYSTSLNKFCI